MRRRYLWLGTAVVAAATATTVALAGLAGADPIPWEEVTVPDLGEGGGLSALDAVSPRNVWAVGNTGPKGDREGLVRHYDGTAWQEVKLPDTAPTMSDVRAFGADQVWTVGGQSAGNFDGSAWTFTDVPMPADGSPWLTSIDGWSKDNLWAVGNTGAVGGGPDGYAFLEHWDGEKWSKVDIPVPAGVTQFSAWQVTAISTDDVWVVGSLYTSGGEKPLLAHYDGSAWTVEDPAGLPDGAGTAVAGLSGEVWMAGFGGDPSDPTDGVPMLLRRDGGKWVQVDTPKETAWVYNLTPDGDGGLIAGGYTPDGTAILHWDGEKAVLEPGPGPSGNGSIADVATVPEIGDVWAIGTTENRPWSAHN